MPRFTRIKLNGLSDVRRMPRLGKIRLGLKVQGRGGKEYPTEVDYFVCPPEVVEKLGMRGREKEIKSLDVFLASDSLDENFPTALKCYRASGLFCEGNGEVASRRDNASSSGWTEMKCPCPLKETGECKEVGVLNVVIPSVSMGAIYQVVTSSLNSIIDIQSGIEHVRKLLTRVVWVPLRLERVATQTSHTDEKTGQLRKQTHYTLRITFPFDIDTVNKLRSDSARILAGPVYLLPEPEADTRGDPVDLITDDELEAAKPAKPADDPAPAAAAPPVSAPEPSAAPAPAPAASPAAAAKPPENGLSAAWRDARTVYGKDASRFWEFLIGTYFQAGRDSASVPSDRAKPVIERLKALRALSVEARVDAAAATWDDLLQEVEARRADATPAPA